MTERRSPHSRDLRKGRFSEPGRIYLVTTTTCDRKPLFSDFACGRVVVEALRFHEQARHAETLAYVVMPDHLHWLFSLGSVKDLSALLKSLKAYSARRLIHHLGISGRIWQPGFHDHALRKEEDIQGVARYIVANPMRAGIAARIGDYPLWDAKWL
jgi:REP-associated tyrosine transposase